MTDKTQLNTLIRFGIEKLSERNAQHEWEHLCRHFARARICSNILPATGPVQAGGDQGRDFETFRTHLARCPIREHTFIGLISEKPLAFACTLQKSLPSKIKGDVKTIMSSGTPIEGIYYFCSRDLPIAKRHELINWAQVTYSVSLEIIDGTGMSEHLIEPDLFWLAERYLELPPGILPSPLPKEEGVDWYLRTLAKWRGITHPASTFADFLELRRAALVAYGGHRYNDSGQPLTDYERPEFPFWIERLDELAEQTEMVSLKRRAFYEASVLRLRGFGTLAGFEDRIQRHFEDLQYLQNATELEEAGTLLTYLKAARLRGAFGLEFSEIEQWSIKFEQQLRKRLQDAKKQQKINERCSLLYLCGYWAFTSEPEAILQDPTEVFNYWTQLVRLAKDAPLFPLEQFADRLVHFGEYFGFHQEYEPLVEAVDKLLAERVGSFKAADKCLERANMFQKQGNLSRAMRQVHRAKIDWFAHETLGKTIFALQWLSQAYIEQHLFFAAKYYAMVAAYLALNEDKLQIKWRIAPSLEIAASCDYAMGAWLGFLELARTCTLIYPHYARDIDSDLENDEGDLQSLVFHIGMVQPITGLLHPSLESFAREQCTDIVKAIAWEEDLTEVQATAVRVIERLGKDELWSTLENQIAGPPWSDVGERRRVAWKAHGITWKIEWRNDFDTTAVAEQFLSALQIILSDFVGTDLCLTRTYLNIQIETCDTNLVTSGVNQGAYKGFNAWFDSGNAERSATVTLPTYDSLRNSKLTFEDVLVGALAVTNTLLEEVSLLPSKRFAELLEKCMKQGLMSKLGIGTSYSTCYRFFVSQECFSRPERTFALTDLPFTSRLSDELPWLDGPGPDYTLANSHTAIRRRYLGFSDTVRYTLPRLLQNKEFINTIERLRGKGWKDWHILAMVANITTSYRMRLLQKAEAGFSEMKQYMARMQGKVEQENDSVIPLSEFSEEKMLQQIKMYILSFAEGFGLELHQNTPDFPAVLDFVTHRYNFWTDDVEHDDPFVVQ